MKPGNLLGMAARKCFSASSLFGADDQDANGKLHLDHRRLIARASEANLKYLGVELTHLDQLARWRSTMAIPSIIF